MRFSASSRKAACALIFTTKEDKPMMNGYDKQEALAFIVKRIHAKDHPELAGQIEGLISQAIDADMAYMHQEDVLDADGNAGEGYYEDDEAFEYIVETLAANNEFTGEEAVKMASLIVEYMDLQQAYLEQKGLVDWD